MVRAPYYQDDLVTLYHGDCREITEWRTADTLIVDPPYGVNYRDKRGQSVANDADFTVTRDALHEWPGAMAVFANHASLPDTLELVRARLSRTRVATWHKTNVNGATGMGNPWMADVEFVVCGVQEWPKRAVSGVIPSRRSTGNPHWQKRSLDAYLHPTQKPLDVMGAVIRAMPDGVIADPFAGSGSTLVAACHAGRRAIGVELDERYCEVIARRLSERTLTLDLDAS